MSADEMTIDIHLSKLVDWLVDRRHCPKDWSQRSIAIRAKIEQSIVDLPRHEQIQALLKSTYLDYFLAVNIVEVLKETEKDTKNLFGIYSSKRMKDWKTIVSNYEKNSIYLVESAQILQRNVAFEIPALKKQIGKCQQIREESLSRHNELEKNIHELEKLFAQLANEMSIEGNNVRKELIDRIEHLPELCDLLLDPKETTSILSLKPAIQFYTDFQKHFQQGSTINDDDLLPIVRYLIEHGNTTVYRWRTGFSPDKIERAAFNYKLLETVETGREDDEKLILDLDENDDELKNSIEGIELKQTSDQIETVDFGTEGEIDWSAIDTVPELLGPSLSSNGNNPTSISEALREAALNGSTQTPVDDGVARGNDGLTVVENRSTYNLLINELHRLQSFLKQRINEHNVAETILMTFVLQNAPSTIQNIGEHDLKSYLKTVDQLLALIAHRQLDRLFLMRDSFKFLDRLINSFQQKTNLIERNRFQQKELEEKASNALKEEQQLKDKLHGLVSYTKQLKELVAKEISTKKCLNHRINIMGEINLLQS